jgi:hypothetical protein
MGTIAVASRPQVSDLVVIRGTIALFPS